MKERPQTSVDKKSVAKLNIQFIKCEVKGTERERERERYIYIYNYIYIYIYIYIDREREREREFV